MKDPTLQILKQYIEKGWPSKEDIEECAQPYSSFRIDLSSHNGVLLKGTRIIIPKSLRKEIKTSIHYGHTGIERCVNRAKMSVFWPNITKEIEDMVANCSTCLNHRNALQRETLIEHEIPQEPWMKVGVDLFSLFEKEYVIAVDYSSKYTEVSQINDETARTVIRKVKKMFTSHGIPREVFSDNGPQFTSTEFKNFKEYWGFQHDTSSPEYPKSNGFIERHIQTVKRALKKAKETKQDPYLVMLMLNTTPDKDGNSPASKLFGRQPRTILPSLVELKREGNSSSQENPESKTKVRYDKASKDLPEIIPGTTVRIYSKSKYGNWRNKGKVVRKRKEPRSYDILNEKGNVVRRNRWQLIPTNEKFEENNDNEYEYEDEYENEYEEEVKEVEESEEEQPIEDNDNTDDDIESNGYVTRYGRSVQQPDRLGYD